MNELSTVIKNSPLIDDKDKYFYVLYNVYLILNNMLYLKKVHVYICLEVLVGFWCISFVLTIKGFPTPFRVFIFIFIFSLYISTDILTTFLSVNHLSSINPQVLIIVLPFYILFFSMLSGRPEPDHKSKPKIL